MCNVQCDGHMAITQTISDSCGIVTNVEGGVEEETPAYFDMLRFGPRQSATSSSSSSNSSATTSGPYAQLDLLVMCTEQTVSLAAVHPCHSTAYTSTVVPRAVSGSGEVVGYLLHHGGAHRFDTC